MRAFSGIEIALWDLIGKGLDRPVYDFLGGLYRERVSFSGYWYPRYRSGGVGGESSPEKLASYCKEVVRSYGYNRLEGKVGVFPPALDVKTVEVIRSEVGSEVELGVDPNGTWSPETAVSVIKKMDKFDLCNVEEPCRELEACARVRSRVGVPISTHCPLLPEVIRLGVADVMVCDHYEVGGILLTKKLVAAAEIHNLGFWIHSAAELGVSTAANLHIAASSPHIIHPSQGTYEHISDDIIKGGKLRIKGGCMEVPQGPGLGVELDEEKVSSYNEYYEDKGIFGFAGYATLSSDSEKPNWWPSLPQW
jgi:glucarate dehydratase